MSKPKVNVSIQFNDASLKRALKDLNKWTDKKAHKAVSGAVKESLRSVASIARSRAPVDTGALKSSIRWQMVTELSGEAGTNVDYAPHVEFGTKPHRIEPTRRQALRWWSKDGTLTFAKSVRHPGTDPQPFMQPAARAEEKMFPRRLIEAIRRA